LKTAQAAHGIVQKQQVQQVMQAKSRVAKTTRTALLTDDMHTDLGVSSGSTIWMNSEAEYHGFLSKKHQA
jgi:hypothetical protein